MKDNPLVSVCIITYNQSALIEEAVTSVLDQIFPYPIEIIIGDDGNTDNTDFIIGRLIKTHPHGNQIKYTRHGINKGVMGNFYWCVEQCKGEYIALCEGDDYWTDPHKLAKQLKLFQANNKCNYAFTAQATLNDKNEIKQVKYNVDIPEYCDLHFILKYNIMPSTQTIMFRRNALDLEELKKYSKSFHGDWVLLFLIASKGQIGYLNEYTAIYREGVGIMSKTGMVRKYKSALFTNQLLNIATHGEFDEYIGDYIDFYQRITYGYLEERKYFWGTFWFLRTLFCSVFLKPQSFNFLYIKHTFKLMVNLKS